MYYVNIYYLIFMLSDSPWLEHDLKLDLDSVVNIFEGFGVKLDIRSWANSTKDFAGYDLDQYMSDETVGVLHKAIEENTPDVSAEVVEQINERIFEIYRSAVFGTTISENKSEPEA